MALALAIRAESVDCAAHGPSRIGNSVAAIKRFRWMWFNASSQTEEWIRPTEVSTGVRPAYDTRTCSYGLRALDGVNEANGFGYRVLVRRRKNASASMPPPSKP